MLSETKSLPQKLSRVRPSGACALIHQALKQKKKFKFSKSKIWNVIMARLFYGQTVAGC